jgi:ABC-type lipopolysaccharide export system ATPase subunit
MSTQEITTIVASKQLKKSEKYMPEEANAFKQISIRKKVRKALSIWDST